MNSSRVANAPCSWRIAIARAAWSSVRASGLASARRALGSQRVRLLRTPHAVSVVGSPSTWDRYGVDGNDDGRTSVYDPADAIPAAARYLAASGAPDNCHAALCAYNHAEWSVAEVLAKAAEYRGSPSTAGDTPELESGVLSDVLHNPRITLTPIQQSDLRSGAIDPRLIATLAWIGRRHSVVITALKSDHSP
jgi:hypothetical protein